MLNITLKCEDVRSEKIANILARFQEKYALATFSIKNESGTVIVDFVVKDISALNELRRRLGHVKKLKYDFTKIEKLKDGDEKNEEIEQKDNENRTATNVI